MNSDNTTPDPAQPRGGLHADDPTAENSATSLTKGRADTPETGELAPINKEGDMTDHTHADGSANDPLASPADTTATTNSNCMSDAQPTPKNGDQPTDPQPTTASVQPAAQMDESTADSGVGVDETPNASEGEEGTGESQLSEGEVEVGEDSGQKNGDEQAKQDEAMPMAARLEAAYAQTKTGLLDRIERERDFGLLWQEAKDTTIPESGIGIEAWAKANLSFSYVYANNCGKLAKNYKEFTPAHEWYRQSGIAGGWRTKRNTGYEYALEVIAFHRKAGRGGSPEPSENKVRAQILAKKKSQMLERERDYERNAKLHLAEELERVINLYRATPAGETFESHILAAVRLEQAQETVSSETKAAKRSPAQNESKKAAVVAIPRGEHATRPEKPRATANKSGDRTQTHGPRPTMAHRPKSKLSVDKRNGGEDAPTYD